MGWIERFLINSMEPILQRRAQVDNPGSINGLKLGKLTPIAGSAVNATCFQTSEERLKHVWLCGASGGGKSTFLLNQCLQDFVHRRPFCLIDPHDLTDKLLRVLLSAIAGGRIPESRLDDIIVVDPARYDWSVAFNPLSARDPHDAFRQATAMMGVLRTIWSDISWGTRTLELCRNLLILIAERGLSLVHAERLLRDRSFLYNQAELLANQEARAFWLERYLKLSLSMCAVCSEPVLNKMSIFLSDPRIRAMLEPSSSDFDFRRLMDTGKWLFIDLNKGQLQEAGPLLASLFLLQLQRATFSRTDLVAGKRRNWFVVVDEFTSFAPASTLVPLLNEGRKFGVGLCLVSQMMANIDRQLVDALRTNCLTQMFFRLSPEDARLASSHLAADMRDLAVRELTSLPVGAAVLFQAGTLRGRLQIENLKVQEELSDWQKQLRAQVRNRAGRMIDQKPKTEKTAALLKRTEPDRVTVPLGGKPGRQAWEELGDFDCPPNP